MLQGSAYEESVLSVMNATVRMERNGSDVPEAAGCRKSVWKSFSWPRVIFSLLS